MANKNSHRHVVSLKRRETTTVKEHLTVKTFALALTCLVGAEIALYSGVSVVPPNWP
jgi:hypothetical protein